MSPTCSSRLLVGRKARSARVRTTSGVLSQYWHRCKIALVQPHSGLSCPYGAEPGPKVDRRADVPLGAQLAPHPFGRLGRRPRPRRPASKRARPRRVRRGQRQHRPRGLRPPGVPGRRAQRAGPRTFGAGPPHQEAATRRELHAADRRARSRAGAPPPAADPGGWGAPRRHARRRAAVDGGPPGRARRLVVRLAELDAQRAAVLQRLDQLGVDRPSPTRARAAPRQASPARGSGGSAPRRRGTGR